MLFRSSVSFGDLIRGGSDGKLRVAKGVFTEGLEFGFSRGVETGPGVVIDGERINIDVFTKIGGQEKRFDGSVQLGFCPRVLHSEHETKFVEYVGSINLKKSIGIFCIRIFHDD